MDRYKAFFEAPQSRPEPVVVPTAPKFDCWFDLDKVVYIDTETSNGQGGGALNPMAEGSRIAIAQTNIHDEIKIHRWSAEVRDWLRNLHNDGYTFVFHNAAFDLYWLLHNGLEIIQVYDTMIASQVINAGKVNVDKATALSFKIENTTSENVGFYNLLDSEDDVEEGKIKKSNRFSHSLQATAYRYANAQIVKDLGNSDWLNDPLTPEQVRYAEDDVKYLPRIVKNQLYFGTKYKMNKVLELEMNLIPALVSMQHRGVLLDQESWRTYAREYGEKAKNLEAELNYAFGMELAEREEEFEESLFGLSPKPFQVSSASQLCKFFEIEKADEQTLKTITHPLISKLLEYKEAMKISSTYGENFLSFLEKDGRIHSAMVQAETATGRLSSRRPNLQNLIPEMLKGMLRSAPKYILMTADYSSVESRILAYAAEDEQFIETVNSKDLHWETAKKIFKLPDDAPRDAELRGRAKSTNFGIPYGISADGLYKRGVTETKEEAQELIDSWMAAFPKVGDFLNQSIMEALMRGYTQDFYGRVRWYEIPDQNAVEPDIYRQARGRAQRQAQNHKIQSLSASITKKALIECWRYLRETGYGYLILTVHDSIFFELKEEYAHISVPVLHRLMEEAGPAVVPGILTPVDYDLGIIEKVADIFSGEKFKQYSLILKDDEIVPNPNRLSPTSEAILKSLKLPLDDLQFAASQIESRFSTQPIEWQKRYEKWITAFRTNVNPG